MDSIKADNNKIAKNTFFLYGRMALVLIVALYTARVVLNTLGIENYGIYNVVGGFVMLFGFLNSTLSSSMQRFYNFELGKRGVVGVSKVYKSGLVIHLALGFAILIILESFGIWYVNNIMILPADRLLSANILYQTSILSLLFVILSIPYMGAIMAFEHMNYYALVSIGDVILKLIIVLVLPYFPFDKLIIYGSLLLSISVINFIAYFVYCKIKISDIFNRTSWDKTLFKSILSFSTWNLIGTFAFMLKGQGLNLLLNAFFGPIINAARGLAFQINGAITGFSGNISTAFRPQLVDAFAKKNIERTKRLMITESKACFFLIALLIVPVIMELKFLLNIWIGNAIPEYTELFTDLVLVDMLICTLNTPCTQVVYAVGTIKRYQVTTSIVNLCLIPVSYLCLMSGYNATSVFVCTIIFSFLNQIVCVYVLSKMFPLSIFEYLKNVCLPCLIYIICLPIIPYYLHISNDMSYVRFIYVVIADIVIGIVLLYYVMCNSKEKIYVSHFVSRLCAISKNRNDLISSK